MPPTVTAFQVQPSATLLNSPLTRDVVITLQWQVQDEHEVVQQQDCTVQLGPGYALAARVEPDKRSYSFRLAKGTTLVLPLTAQVEAHLADRTLAPAHNAVAIPSGPITIQFPSAFVPEREAISTVYGELNQELRRTRTLYESFLVAVTGGLAALYSKREVIVAASHRGWMLVGLVALAIIVVYMLWAVSRRYTRSITWVGNLERALGVRGGDPPPDLMPDQAAWWSEHAWPHTLWAIMLTAYVGVLVLSAGYLLVAKPEKTTTSASPTQTVCCACIQQETCSGGTSERGSQTGAKPTDKPAASGPPGQNVEQGHQ